MATRRRLTRAEIAACADDFYAMIELVKSGEISARPEMTHRLAYDRCARPSWGGSSTTWLMQIAKASRVWSGGSPEAAAHPPVSAGLKYPETHPDHQNITERQVGAGETI